MGRRIAEAFTGGFSSVLLENHGVVIGGSDLQEAFQRFETLEFTAKTVIKARLLGPVRYLSAEQIALAGAARPRFAACRNCDPGPASTRGGGAAPREDLCTSSSQRGCRQRLMTSTEGSFSARLDGDAFVITSYRIDRHTVAPEQLTLVQDGRAEAGKRPSRAAVLHRAIYRRHPAVQAILNATPVNATAFSVTATLLDARTIPESYILLRDVAVVPFGMQYEDGERIAALVSPERPVALLENDGALILGTSVLDAFDRLEVLEATAEAVINSRAIGAVRPMSDGTIEELVRAFLTPKGS